MKVRADWCYQIKQTNKKFQTKLDELSLTFLFPGAWWGTSGDRSFDLILLWLSLVSFSHFAKNVPILWCTQMATTILSRLEVNRQHRGRHLTKNRIFSDRQPCAWKNRLPIQKQQKILSSDGVVGLSWACGWVFHNVFGVQISPY